MNKKYKYIIPLILASSTAVAENSNNIVDTGNTSWLLVCSALVMLMTPGLAFFYAGLVNRKNVVSTLLQNYVALAVIGLIWITVGYSLVFTTSNGIIGSFDAVMLSGMIGKTYSDTGIPLLAFVAFQMMFAIITPALITGAIAERVKFKPWVAIMALWCIFVYLPVAHWVWGPDGWIANLGAIDFAGGLVVHITAGFSGLVAAILYGRRENKGEASTPNDVPMVMLGAALLWFGWFGFNAGSALTSGFISAHAFITTFIGGAAAFLSWMVTDMVIKGKPSAVGAAVGIVCGLVCITPAAGFVDIKSAILMCITAGFICNVSAIYFKKITKLDDTLDVFACHGIGAVIGSILTGVFATKAINPSLVNEGLLINGSTKLFFANLISTCSVVLYSTVITYIIIKIINSITPVKANEQEQKDGLDESMHGESADHN